MKKTFILLLISLIFIGSIQAQTFSVNTMTQGTNYAGNNGSNSITFSVDNQSFFATTLDSIKIFKNGAPFIANNKYYLYSSNTNLGGQAYPFTTANGWTMVDSTDTTNIQLNTITPLFSNLNISIPTLSGIRFAIVTDGMVSYASPGATPNFFNAGPISGGNVLVGCGNYNNGNNMVGYAHLNNFGTPSHYPDRYFVGELVFTGSAALSNSNITTKNFSLYPNPAGDKLYIKHEGISVKEVSVKISNMLGKTMHYANYNLAQHDMIDIHNYAEGLYIVQLYDTDDKIIFQSSILKK